MQRKSAKPKAAKKRIGKDQVKDLGARKGKDVRGGTVLMKKGGTKDL